MEKLLSICFDENCFSLLVGVIHSTERESFDVRKRNPEIAESRIQYTGCRRGKKS
jgi:hypothetical protein